MEAEMKLNDFTTALDSIRFLDDGDVVPLENSFEKDYSLLESIWLDISNPIENSELSTPSTSGISPLDDTLSRTSHVLEISKTTPKKVKRSLFKPKTPKKNKIKNKSNAKKIKEDLVIDLCKEDSFSEIFENVQSSSETKTNEVNGKTSPSSSASDNSHSNFESSVSFVSNNIPEVNSSLDCKLGCKVLEKGFIEKINVDSETVINEHPKSESSFMSKSKCLESTPNPQVSDIPPALKSEDVSANISRKTPNEELDLKDSFNSDSKLIDISKDKVNGDENLEVKPESTDDVISVTREITSEVEVVEEKNESQISLEKQSNLLTTNIDVTKMEPPVNKIVISCKNFSKIGFKNEEIEEKLINRINEVSEEIISTIDIDEDPILKRETLKEDTLTLKEDDIPSERLSFELIDNSFNDEELSWDNRLEVNCSDIGTSKLSSTEIENLSKDISSNDCNSAKFNFVTEITRSKTDSFDLFHDKTNDVNKRTPKRQVGGVDKVLSQVVLNSEDDSTNSLCGQMFQIQDFLQEHNKTVQLDSTIDNKTVTESDSQDGDTTVNSVYKSSQTCKIISAITGVDLKSGTKMVHKTISTIINELKESSTSSDSSNQESSEVSSSSFDDNFQMKNDNFSKFNSNLLVERHDSQPCKVENEHFKGFSTCMQTSTYKTSEPQFDKKSVEHIQVPLNKCIYINDKANFIEDSQSLSLPKNENDLHNQSFNLHKGLNTCLLHKILGEEDCLKSGCLLKNSVAEKNRQDLNKSGFSDVSLKQELENSSELPTDSSTPTISSLWNPTAGVKVEKDNENSGSSECIEGIRNPSSEFLIRSVTEACNFKELDYNIGGNECDNLTASYDCESDCEDRNLVIDEDIESFKDQTETEESPLKHKSVSVQSDERSPIISTNNNNNSMDKKLWNKNIVSVVSDPKEQTLKTTHVTKENNTPKKEISGKHKLPRILESKVNTSSLRNPYSSEDLSFRYLTQNSEVLMTSEGCTQYISTPHSVKGVPSVDSKHYAQTKFSNQTEGNFNISQIPSGHRVLSPYSPVNCNIDLNSIRSKNRDPRLGPVSGRTNVNAHQNVNIPMKVNSLESIGPVNQLGMTQDIAKANSPRLIASPNQYDLHTQYNLEGKMPIPSNRSSNSPVEQYSQSTRKRNEKFRSLETICQNRESPVNKFQENSNLVSYTNLATFVDGSNMKDNSNTSLIKFGASESQKIKVGEPYDFNVFPIAQEVEICSGSENLGGEWLYPSSSEIGHPDWPIANEQNVIDSSNYSQTAEQFMYSLLKGDEGSAMPEPDQTCYIPLELQQIDNRHPKIVGKNVNKDKLNLHLRTLECDYNLSCSQSEFKEFYLSRDLPPTIPVPFPPQARTDNSTQSTVRCPCEQCSDNHQKLLSNYNILTHFRNSKIKPSGYPRLDEASFSDKEQNGEFDCSLPLKKRKTLTNSKSSDDLILPSYPNTPMISIAQLELTGYDQGNHVIVPNPQSQWRDAMAYNPLNLVQPSTIEQYDGQTKGKRKSSKRRKSSR